MRSPASRPDSQRDARALRPREWLLAGGPTTHHADAGAWGAAIYAGVIGLALSSLTFNYALGKVSAATAGLALNLVPLIGVTAAVAVAAST